MFTPCGKTGRVEPRRPGQVECGQLHVGQADQVRVADIDRDAGDLDVPDRLGRRRPPESSRAHLDGDVAASGTCGGPDAAAGVERQPAGRRPAGVDQVAGEQPGAVAAHLRQRAVGVAVVHDEARRAAGRRRGDPDHAVGAEAGVPVAERADLGRGQLECAVGVGQQDEVVLGAVALDERHPGAAAGSGQRRHAGRRRRFTPSAYGGRAASAASARSSRSGAAGVQVDHPVVATEPGALPADEPPGGRGGRGDRLLEVSCRRPARPATGRSPAPGTRSTPRRSPAASRAADLVEEPGVDHRRDPVGPAARRARRSAGPAGAARRRTRGRPGRGMVAVNGRPVSSMTSSARTILRPLAGPIAGRGGRVQSRAAANRPSMPSRRRSSSSRARTCGSVAGKSISSTTDWMYRPDPPTRIGVRPRARMSSMAARASR